MEAHGPTRQDRQQRAQTADPASDGKPPRRGGQGGTARRPLSRLQTAAATICAVAVLLACGGGVTAHLSVAPAARLYLDIRFQQALIPSTSAIVLVRIHDAQQAAVELTNHQRLTVNGRDRDPSLLGGYSFTVPRPPPEGRYTIVYTDEGGHQASVVVPAPPRDLTITSPAAHAQVPIPQSRGQLAVRYAIPFPSTSPLSQRPFSTGVFAGVEGPCKAGRPDGIPASALSCINVGSAQQATTGNAVISDTGVVPGMGLGFDNLASGPGEMYVHMTVAGDLLSSGFASVQVSFDDVATIPIMWV
ncbi:MAG TPA: hypothetical protein VF116_21740 [Ktedonobacterales bacterium]